MGETTVPQGSRILIVDDESLIAMLLEDIVLEEGCVVVGPAHDVASALSLMASTTIDAALLDLNLAGVPADPIADALRAKGIPMIFCTGSGRDDICGLDPSVPVLMKPFRAVDVAATLRKLFA